MTLNNKQYMKKLNELEVENIKHTHGIDIKDIIHINFAEFLIIPPKEFVKEFGKAKHFKLFAYASFGFMISLVFSFISLMATLFGLFYGVVMWIFFRNAKKKDRLF